MKVLLLGASGLLGHNVMSVLMKRDIDVVVYVRSRGRLHLTGALAGYTKLTVVEGSLHDAGAVKRAAGGCQAIINCAGTTDMSLLRYEDYLPVNRDLCRLLTEVMEEAGIDRLVHVSTANTIGYGTADRPGRESYEMCEPFSSSYYAQSKREGEKYLIEKASERKDWHIVVVNPGFMVGAYDVKPSSGKLLLAGYRKPLMAAPCGGKSFIHVMDAAEAVVNAISLGTSGERYLLTGYDMSLKDFYAIQARVCGYMQRFVALPSWLVNTAGRIGDFLRLLHIPTQLSIRNVRQLQVMEYYDNSKAVNELGMPRTSMESAIKDFFEWRKEAAADRKDS